MAAKDQYLTWLNNAYAMEQDITKTLEGQINDFDGYPEAQQKVKEHLEITKRQAEDIKKVIERNGGDTSTVKSFMANMTGMMKGMSMEMMGDKVVKNSIANFAVEHMEIASYKSLIATAEEVGDSESIPVFEAILKEEEEMAQWLDKNMPTTLKQYLSKVE